ncbi:MAG: NUDIX domain-containing protein, partial [Saprospiraceae bacterium]|nr:NUDIX domain-containing protein [Saprospiraceae bacterium]
KTLDKWFQPGGHTEPGDLDIWETARREAEEETGIENLTNLSASIFDLDVHIIPEKGELPAHFHYDVRVAFLAETEVLPPTNTEVNGLAWVSLDTLLRQLDTQQSLRRMAIKSLLLSAF